MGSGYEKPKSKEIKMIPKHTAIIMDGNGRWAEQKGMPRVFGHQNGVSAVKKIVEEANKHKIEYLTLFTFSVENWDRPSDEVDTLMKLLVQTLKDEFEDIFNNNIKLNAIGDLNSMPEKVKTELNSIIENTKKKYWNDINTCFKLRREARDF